MSLTASDDVASYWYVSEAGRTFGPFTPKMVEERLANHSFGRTALVWRNGWPNWQPIAVHFNRQPAAAPIVSQSDNSVADLRTTHSVSAMARWFFFLITIAAVSAFEFGVPLLDIETPVSFVVLRLAIIGALSIGGVFAVLSWWNYAKRAPQQSQGIVRVAIVLWGTVMAVVTLAAITSAPFAYRLQVAKQNFKRYTVQTDVLTGILYINGLVGPGLSRSVQTQLEANAGIKTIQINSFGGLVDEALNIANVIEQRGLSVKAEGACNSACIIIFMSGRERIAPRSMRFGFHAVSSITPIKSAFNQAALDELDAKASAYLEQRGIPAWVVVAARKVGPKDMLPVTAVKMADMGAVTQLLEGEHVVSVERAKWLDLMDGLAREHMPPELMALFQAIYEAKPELALDYGSRLWGEAVAGHGDNVEAVTRELISKMVLLALPAASDNALSMAIRVEFAESQLIRATQRWDICNNFFAGKGFGPLSAPPQLAAMEFSADAALVRTASRRNWRPATLPTWADSAGKELTLKTAETMLSQGEDIRQISTNPRTSCDWSSKLMQAVARMPPREGAPLYRWLISQN